MLLRSFSLSPSGKSMRVLIYLLATTMVSAWTQQTFPVHTLIKPPDSVRDVALDKAIVKALDLANQEAKPVKYEFNRVSLNDKSDNMQVLVYVEGRDVCGSGGCTVLLFSTDGKGFKLISLINLARVPVVVSDQRSHGWKNLIMPVSGGGIVTRHCSVLRFDGKTYPGNPTLAPAIARDKITGTSYFEDVGSGRATFNLP